MTLLTSISLESVQSLEEIFSYLTPNGWVVPAWLSALREHVLAADHPEQLLQDLPAPFGPVVYH